MRRYIVFRIFQSIIALFILSLVIFILVRAGSDPALLMVNEMATEEDYQDMRVQLGLDKPIYIQYGIFASKALTGNFGRSIRTRKLVAVSISEAIPNSAKLGIITVLFALLFSIPMGVIAAVKKGTYIDTLVRLFAGLGQSVPTFWVGLMMISLFVVKMKLLPAAGMGSWKHYIMPASCSAFFLMAGVIRLLRSTMLDVLDSEFIKLARIKGVSENAVIWKHALKNGLSPVLGFCGVYIAVAITGAILVETIFAWPGFGRLAYTAITNQDFPLIQGVILTAGVIVMIANFLTDILYAFLDPRIRY